MSFLETNSEGSDYVLRLFGKIFWKCIRVVEIFLNFLVFKCNKVICGSSLKNIRGIVFVRNFGNLIIEKNVKINSRYSANPIGGMKRMSFVVRKNAELLIDENTGISNSAIVCWSKIHIGKNVFIGGDCKIYDTDFHSINLSERVLSPDPNVKVAPVTIEDGVFIGTGTVILKGVTVGRESVIGAGSVVAKDIPAREIWAGNPARFIRKI